MFRIRIYRVFPVIVARRLEKRVSRRSCRETKFDERFGDGVFFSPLTSLVLETKLFLEKPQTQRFFENHFGHGRYVLKRYRARYILLLQVVFLTLSVIGLKIVFPKKFHGSSTYSTYSNDFKLLKKCIFLKNNRRPESLWNGAHTVVGSIIIASTETFRIKPKQMFQVWISNIVIG